MNPAEVAARFQRINCLQPSIIALVLANLVPLAGVFIFHWEVFPLLFLFWLENVVIGILNVLKILFASPGFSLKTQANPAAQEKFGAASASRMEQFQPMPQDQPGTVRKQRLQFLSNPKFQWALKLLLIPFFCVQYGIFTFVHGTILVALFAGDSHHTLHFLNVPMIFQIIRDNHLECSLAGLVFSHLVSFGYDYLWRGEFRQTNVIVQMVQPFSRVVVMHLTILIGGILMMALKSPAAGLAFLVCLKIVFDLYGHQREREKIMQGGD